MGRGHVMYTKDYSPDLPLLAEVWLFIKARPAPPHRTPLPEAGGQETVIPHLHIDRHSPVLQIHLHDLPKALEETLHVPFPGPMAQAPDIDPR